jgi:hypothetical protein
MTFVLGHSSDGVTVPPGPPERYLIMVFPPLTSANDARDEAGLGGNR